MREIMFFKRCVDANARMLAPLPAALKAELLGELDPELWELSVLMPTRPLPTDAKLAERELKAARACRYHPMSQMWPNTGCLQTAPAKSSTCNPYTHTHYLPFAPAC
jgi:hypothetical protein